MAINFPSAPNTGDSHTDGSVTWIYNGSAWDSLYQPTAKAQVGLGNVDNTSDEDKPVSTAQQAALDALTKDDVGLDNVDNTSDINKPVSTAQQAAIDAAGGSSFDQDLNTTDSPTFATLTTTDTIATDVYAVDVAATGTVTADAVSADTFQIASGVFEFDVGVITVAKFTAGNAEVRGNHFPTYNDLYTSGTSSKRWSNVFTVDVDASGTVTAGKGLFNTPTVGSQYALEVQSNGTKNFTIDGYGNTESKSILPRSANVFNMGASNRRWKEVFTQDIDASGTVTAGGFVGTPQTLTDAASITYDLADGHNAKVTLTADRILLFPANVAEGASGVLTVTQDGTGGHALTFGTGWFISAGAAADIAALGAGEKAQVTWYAHSTSDANATILPLQ